MIQKSCSQLKQCIKTCITWDINKRTKTLLSGEALRIPQLVCTPLDYSMPINVLQNQLALGRGGPKSYMSMERKNVPARPGSPVLGPSPAPTRPENAGHGLERTIGDEQKTKQNYQSLEGLEKTRFIKIHPSIFLDKNGSMLCYSFKNLHGPSG